MDDVKDKMKGFINKISAPAPRFKGKGHVLGSSSSSSSAPSPAAASRLIPAAALPSPAPVAASPAPNLTPVPAPPAAAAPGFPAAASPAAAAAAAFLSTAPAEGAVSVVLRLLRNVVQEPGNEKFRRIRMGNAKIKEALGEGREGVGLLEAVGFSLGEEDGGEVWATMEEPDAERVEAVKEAVSLLEQWKPAGEVAAVEPKMIDRKVRVFYSVAENVAAKIELPASFFERSGQEIKREAEMRKKKLAESQLLIPKSFREKQALAARKKYNLTVIRIQFPDGVVLQGVFSPREPTTVLYEFVRTALKETSLDFEVLRPAVPRPRVISCSPKAGGRTPTLEEEELVPTALVKFRPIETDSVVFTGLSNELLEIIEPLTNATIDL